MEEEGQGAEPEIVNHENLSLTGYFNEGNKRIDIILVFKDDGDDKVKETRLNFLMNAISLGLQIEIETGKLVEHKNLVFVKLHAPDEIIEQYGLHYNEKSFFKDSHIQFINPILKIFSVWNERDLIKTVRTQYPGPDNYSTLERSNIVYKILLELPFGKSINHYGLNKLINKYIFLDVFALHDGPYFMSQNPTLTNTNARQVLFYEWLGILNIWKMQPIHMIHEYLGKRIAYYMAFYEYFNIMLIIPAIISVWYTYIIYTNKEIEEARFRTGNMREHICVDSRNIYICPECRNYKLCPFIFRRGYCDEIKFLIMIDKEVTLEFGKFIVMWGIFFLIPWRYREKYLTWIWEVPKKHINDLVRPEYNKPLATGDEDKRSFLKNWKTEPGHKLNIFMNILTAVCVSLWTIFLFRLSVVMWHYPRWKRLQLPSKRYPNKDDEHKYIAEMAALYTIITFVVKKVFMVLAQIITDIEKNNTFLVQDISISFKLCVFGFMNSFTILNTFTYVGAFYQSFRDVETLHNYMPPYGSMNSGYGSTFDDICIIVGVMTILEHVIFQIPLIFKRDVTDYSLLLDRCAPCWEREYKLKPITESFFLKGYYRLSMQFALLTCYSMSFPLASLCILIVNILDIRHTARELLLEHRRPLLINISGPGFWKTLFIIIAHFAPFFTVAVLIFQSQIFNEIYMPDYYRRYFQRYTLHERIHYKSTIAHKEFKAMTDRLWEHRYYVGSCEAPYQYEPFLNASRIEQSIRIILYVMVLGFVLDFFLRFIFPATSQSLENSIRREQLIKDKYFVRKGIDK